MKVLLASLLAVAGVFGATSSAYAACTRVSPTAILCCHEGQCILWVKTTPAGG